MISKRRGTTSYSHTNGPNLNSNGGLYTKPVTRCRNHYLPWIMLLGFTIIYAAFYSSRGSDDSISLIVDDLSNRILAMHSYPGDTAPTKSIPRISIHSSHIVGRGSKEPILLEEWTLPSGDWTQRGLMKRVGNFPQYLKDLTVQPIRDARREVCVLPGEVVASLLPKHNLLFFTNNKENEQFMKKLHRSSPPTPVQHINGFEVFSVMGLHKSHSFHRHGESWLGQVEGRRQWWFLPPDTTPPPPRVNACGYLTGESVLPLGVTTITQEPGQIIWFPKDWYHATCALDDWTLGIGAQQGPIIRQKFDKLDKWAQTTMTTKQIRTTIEECLGKSALNDFLEGKVSLAIDVTKPSVKKKADGESKWQWFDGDLNAYYNSLEKDHNRDPNKPSDYAVHRWLGPNRSTEEQYLLLNSAATRFLDPTLTSGKVQVLDGGCGLGSGLMWMEQTHPTWNLTGYTVSEEQYRFIEKLPRHKFKVHLRSYDQLEPDSQYDFIYSIEALIHSPNVTHTMQVWASHLKPGGVMAILDDFVVGGLEEKATDGMQEFANSWLANSLFSTRELGEIGKKNGLQVVEDRDLITEYNIIGLNYHNKTPDIRPFGGRVHQGWMGSKWRQRLTVEGKLTYNLLVMKSQPVMPPLHTLPEE